MERAQGDSIAWSFDSKDLRFKHPLGLCEALPLLIVHVDIAWKLNFLWVTTAFDQEKGKQKQSVWDFIHILFLGIFIF